jgi:hypothetical protein
MSFKLLFLCFFIFFSNFSFAGKIDKAFESLKQMNYFEAKMLFEKELSDFVTPASYGLSVIYFRTDNPFHNLDSANKYIAYAEINFGKQTEKEIKRFSEYGVTYDAILELQFKIIREFYHIAKEVNTEEAYVNFIHNYPNSFYLPDAMHRRDSIILAGAFEVNKSYYYDSILQRYPLIENYKVLKDRYELTYFVESTNGGSTLDYVNFILNNPTSRYIKEAQDNVYKLETSENSIESYDSYIRRFPSYYNIGNAWRMLYKLYMLEYSDDRVKEFKKAYPNYPFKDELKRDMDLAKLVLFPFKEDSLFGFMNHKGIQIYPPSYQSLSFFSEGLALASKGKKFGYIDKLNNVVIPFHFDSGTDFNNGRAIVEINGKFGIINRSGSFILNPEFIELSQYSEGLLYGMKDSLYGYYNMLGDLIIPHRFSDAFSFNKGIARVIYDEKVCFIDTLGNYLVEPLYESIEFFSDSLLIFKDTSGLYGILNLRNQVVTKPEFDNISSLNDGMAIFVQRNKIGYLDATGQKIIKNIFDVIPNYMHVCTFKDGFARVRYKGKYGVIDKKGGYYLKPEYSGLGEISSVVSFTKGKQWGYISLKDKKVSIIPVFDFASSFHYGLAIVEVNALQGVINEKGKWIIPSIFTQIDLIADNFYLVSNGASYGLYSLSGEKLIDLEFQSIRSLSKDLLILNKGNTIYYYHLLDHKLIALASENE